MTSARMIIRGKTSYAKILGEPVLNYSKDGKEWKMDLLIDKDTEKELKSAGIGDRVKRKENYLDNQPYITFKQAEFQKSGKANDPIAVKDILGEAWPNNRLIGNGSDVDVTFAIQEYGTGLRKGVYIRSVRVLKLVPYEKEDFTPIDESDPFYKERKVAEDRKTKEEEEFKKDFDVDEEVV